MRNVYVICVFEINFSFQTSEWFLFFRISAAASIYKERKKAEGKVDYRNLQTIILNAICNFHFIITTVEQIPSIS